MGALLKRLKEFNYTHIYNNPLIKGETAKIEGLFERLFQQFLTDVRTAPLASPIWTDFLAPMDRAYLESRQRAGNPCGFSGLPVADANFLHISQELFFPQRLHKGFAGAAMLVMTFNLRFATPLDGPDQWEQRKDLAVEIIRRQAPTCWPPRKVPPAMLRFLEAELTEYRPLKVPRGEIRLPVSHRFSTRPVLHGAREPGVLAVPRPGGTPQLQLRTPLPGWSPPACCRKRGQPSPFT